MFNKAEFETLVEKYLVDAGSNDIDVAAKAQRSLAAAITTPLRSAVLPGDIHSNIFNKESVKLGTTIEYHMDIMRPGLEGDFVAFTMPGVGRIPDRFVTSDRIMVNTYRVANAVDTAIDTVRTANFNIIARMMQVMEYGHIQKRNDDCWSVLINAGYSRNLMVYDADATAGQFTPRLVQLAKTVMRRNGGGNSASTSRGKLTDLYLSPESADDIRTWGIDLIPDAVRAQIYYSTDGSSSIMKVFDVNIHDIDELGVGQKYQLYLTSTLGGSLASTDTELCVGLDLSNNDSFVMPVSQEMEVREDMTLHRQGRIGFYSSERYGVSCLDNRRVILLSC